MNKPTDRHDNKVSRPAERGGPHRQATRRRIRIAATAVSLSLGLAVSGGLTGTNVLSAATKATAARPTTTVKRPATTIRKPKPTTPKPTTPKPTTTRRPVTASSATTATLATGTAKACTTTKIMPLGDSLTAFAESYRGPLYRTLVAKGHKVDFVGSLSWAPTGGGDPDSEGHGGFRIGPDDQLDSNGKPANIAQNIDAWLKLSKPDLVLLTIGTNDLSAGGATAAAAPQKLKTLVTNIVTRNPSIVVIVGDIPPNAYNAKSPETNAVNDAARTLGEQSATDNIFYSNTFTAMNNLGFDVKTGLSDGTHFTVDGGEVFAKALLPTVESVLTSRSC